MTELCSDYMNIYQVASLNMCHRVYKSSAINLHIYSRCIAPWFVIEKHKGIAGVQVQSLVGSVCTYFFVVKVIATRNRFKKADDLLTAGAVFVFLKYCSFIAI